MKCTGFAFKFSKSCSCSRQLFFQYICLFRQGVQQLFPPFTFLCFLFQLLKQCSSTISGFQLVSESLYFFVLLYEVISILLPLSFKNLNFLDSKQYTIASIYEVFIIYQVSIIDTRAEKNMKLRSYVQRAQRSKPIH